MSEQIVFAEVLQPDQTFVRIMIINSRGANFVRFQELRDLDVVTILFALEIVFHQNQRLLRRATNPIEFSV